MFAQQGMKRNSAQLEESEASPENPVGHDSDHPTPVDLTAIEDDKEQKAVAVLKSLGAPRPEWLMQDVEKAEKWVQENAPSFRFPVLGPIGKHVLPNTSLAAAVLEHIMDSSKLQYFVTQSKFDSELINKAVEELKIPETKLIYVPPDHLVYDRLLMEDTTKELKEQFGVEGFLQDMLSCHPSVWSCLRTLQPKLHNVLLGKPLDSNQLLDFNQRILRTELPEKTVTLATQSDQGELSMMNFPFHSDIRQEWYSFAPASFLKVTTTESKESGVSCDRVAKKPRTTLLDVAEEAPIQEAPNPSEGMVSQTERATIVPKLYKHFPDLEQSDKMIAEYLYGFQTPQIFPVVSLVKPPNPFLAAVLEHVVPRWMWETYIVTSELDYQRLVNMHFPASVHLDVDIPCSSPLFTNDQMQVLKRNHGVLGCLHDEPSLCGTVMRFLLNKCPEIGRILVGAPPTADNLEALVEFLSRNDISSVSIASCTNGATSFCKINVDHFVQFHTPLAQWKINEATFLWNNEDKSFGSEKIENGLTSTLDTPGEEDSSDCVVVANPWKSSGSSDDPCVICVGAPEDTIEVEKDVARAGNDSPQALPFHSEDDDLSIQSPLNAFVRSRDDGGNQYPSKRARLDLDASVSPTTSIGVVTAGRCDERSNEKADDEMELSPTGITVDTATDTEKLNNTIQVDPAEPLRRDQYIPVAPTNPEYQSSLTRKEFAGETRDDLSFTDSHQEDDSPEDTANSTLIDPNDTTLEHVEVKEDDEEDRPSHETFRNVQISAIFLRVGLVLGFVALAAVACWLVMNTWQQYSQNMERKYTDRVLKFMTLESELVAGVVSDIGNILGETDALTAKLKNMRREIDVLGEDTLLDLTPFHLMAVRLDHWDDTLKHFHHAVNVYAARLYLERLSIFTVDGQLYLPQDSHGLPLMKEAVAQISEWKEQQTEIADEITVLDATFRKIKLQASASTEGTTEAK